MSNAQEMDNGIMYPISYYHKRDRRRASKGIKSRRLRERTGNGKETTLQLLPESRRN